LVCEKDQNKKEFKVEKNVGTVILILKNYMRVNLLLS